VFGNLALAMSDAFSSGGGLFARYRRPYWAVAAAALGLLAGVFALAPLARMFAVALPSPAVLLGALGLSLVASGWWGAVRWLRRAAERA
jgi:hypothetical protein